MQAAQEERERKRSAEADRRLRLREAADAAERQENRRGSNRRGAYTARFKLKVLDVFDEIRANPAIPYKIAAFEADPRSKSTPYSTVKAHWASPADRANISRGAGKEYAASLLRIDKASGIRRQGKYAEMEKLLYQKFKERRARGRKVSGRWLTAMGRQLVRVTDPRSEFKGGKTWRRRFCLRFKIRMRRKTNAKNKTWADSEPVLLRYLRGLRKRLQLDDAIDDELMPPLAVESGEESEPEDVDPGREPEEREELLDSSDDEDPDDVLIELAAALPTGYQVGPPPEAEQLGYKHARGEELVGRPILFNWKAVGWCSGTIQNINADQGEGGQRLTAGQLLCSL